MSEATKTRQRDRVRELLESSDVGLDATEVGDALGVHVTSARFHLNNLVTDGIAITEQLAPEGVGRPRVAYRIAPPAAADSLNDLLLMQLGTTARAREDAAAAGGREWARRHAAQAAQTALPDPVIAVQAALAELGLSITDITSDPHAQHVTICSCPLADITGVLPEIARGTVRGVAEQALDVIAETFGVGYLVQATTVDDCTVSLRLTDRPLLQNSR
ncbi:helix-turn-helix domain-containing protein [Gordonia sp. MP11Mi]|uniref:Transcriptional regulator n=1 Tax=Gordonia sp. MP11Mi TaxID=3022769 RepID=A0AA97GVK9_9ACTN